MADYPIMPWYPRDWISDTRKLSLEERGAYHDLLNFSWLDPDGSLPDDDRELARILGITAKVWARLRPRIEPLFTIENGRWFQKRVRAERNRVRVKSISAATSGRAGGLSKSRRYKEMRLANATIPLQRNPIENVATLTLTPESPSRVSELPYEEPEHGTNIPQAAACGDRDPPSAVNGMGNGHGHARTRFDEFWSCWDIPGTKRERTAAKTKYDLTIKANRVDHETLCAAVRRYMAWCRKHPEWGIKYPATWLNKGCWEDDLSEPNRGQIRSATDDDSNWGLYS